MKTIFAIVLLFMTKLEGQMIPQQTVLPPPEVTVSKTDTHLEFSLEGRKVASFPRGDVIKGDLQSSWHKNADGTYTYDMAVDTTDVWLIRLGDELTDKQHARPNVRETSELSRGWRTMGSDVYIPDATIHPRTKKIMNPAYRGRDAKFSVRTNRKPGLVAVSLVSEAIAHTPLDFADDLSVRERYAVQITMLENIGFETNSLRHYVIGPAIAPDATRDDLLDLVRVWVNSYGFGFLSPLLDAGSLEDGLNAVKPVTALDREIVACLWSAL